VMDCTRYSREGDASGQFGGYEEKMRIVLAVRPTDEKLWE
jgi:hypothetical protein